MAAIREELVLVDRFSSTFSQFLRMSREAEALLRRLGTGHGGYDEAVRRSTAALEQLAGASQRTNTLLEELAGSSRRTNDLLEQMSRDLHDLRESSGGAADAQGRLNRNLRNGSSAAGALLSKIRNLVTAYLGLRGVQSLIRTSDTWTQTTARLERMNDGRQDTPAVQAMIFDAAQRSRGIYQDMAGMVAKLGTLAGEAFGSTEEVVAFAEQINKQFALAGTSAQGAQAAMLQLTQAMSSGVLRGEELNSVLEQAPTITQAIAKYMGVTIGELRKLAGEGQVTAEVVKAAMFAAAAETNAAFEAVPMTFSQAWTLVKNEGLNAIRPVLEELNAFLNSDIGRGALNGFIAAVRMGGGALLWLLQLVERGAEWIAENWNTVSTALIGGAIAVGAVMAASAVRAAAAWAAANLPLLLFVGTITLIIYKAREMGATWEDVGAVVGGVLYELYAVFYNITANAWNLIATFAEFFANVFHNPVAAIAHLFADLADWVLSVLQSLASAIDAVFGSSLANAVNGWRNSVQDWAGSFGENEIKIQRMEKIQYDDAWDRGTQMGRSVGAALDNFSAEDFLSSMGGTGFDYDALAAASGISNQLKDIGADTKAIKNSVSLSEEDIKLLVDLAEREYITNVNLTAQTPIINVSGQNTGGTDLDRQLLADAIRDILLEQSASHTDLSYT